MKGIISEAGSNPRLNSPAGISTISGCLFLSQDDKKKAMDSKRYLIN
jgi:hypothetical protein